ncbi:NUDIX hydrolase [Sabulibacter ruber]|uniref:NUDIX hydrolase n=1 Tax=Sabulibacter ruber TaxID=2811901 RepID=UPI003BF9AF44
MGKRPRLAAVNILLYNKGGEWFFPLIVLKQDKHSGQIALPGGKVEGSDASFAETAVRETHEEIEVGKGDIRIIREISPVYVPPSNFYVHAFISYTVTPPEFFLRAPGGGCGNAKPSHRCRWLRGKQWGLPVHAHLPAEGQIGGPGEKRDHQCDQGGGSQLWRLRCV